MSCTESEIRFIEEFIFPLTRNIRGGNDLDLADVASKYERAASARLAELRGMAVFPMAAGFARRDPAATAPATSQPGGSA